MSLGPTHGRRSPVVLVPGFSGDPARDFGLIAPMLARHRRVEQVDLRHVRDANGIDLAILSAVRGITADTGERPVLVGASLGGTAAMRFATRHGDLLDRVVAIAAWLQPAAALVDFGAVWATLRAERSTAVQAVAGALLSSPAGRDRWRALPESAVTDTLIAIATRLDAGDVSTLTVPALVISGDADAVATTRAARLLAAAADADLRIVPGGHDVLAERPVEVLAQVTAFTAARSAIADAATTAVSAPAPEVARP